MDKNYEIGNFITACREEKKITQSKLGELLGVTNKSVSKWENGKALPDTKIMPPLCEILGITVNELLNGKRNPVTSSPVLDDLSRLIQVSKYYHDDSRINIGLKDVNLTFNLGEVVAVTGVSGSGKTTLLKTIGGMDSFEQGEIYLKNEGISRYDEMDYESYRKKYISYIFQEYGVLEKYSLIDNLILVRLMMGDPYPIAKAKSADMLKKVFLYQYRHKKANKLSGGQKQKLAVARALVKDAPIILGDEITASLDSKQGKEVLRLLFANSKGKLVILVTHHFEELAEYCTRRITLAGGSVAKDEILEPVEKSEMRFVEPKKKALLSLSYELFRKIVKNNLGYSALLALLVAVPSAGLIACNCGLDRAYKETMYYNKDSIYADNELLVLGESGLKQADVDAILSIDGVERIAAKKNAFSSKPSEYVIIRPDLDIDEAIVPVNEKEEDAFSLVTFQSTDGVSLLNGSVEGVFNVTVNPDAADENTYVSLSAYYLLQSMTDELSDPSNLPTLYAEDVISGVFSLLSIDFRTPSTAIEIENYYDANVDRLSMLGLDNVPFSLSTGIYQESISIGYTFLENEVTADTIGTNLFLLVDESKKPAIERSLHAMNLTTVGHEDEEGSLQSREMLFMNESLFVLVSVLVFVLLLLVSRKLVSVVMKRRKNEMDLLRKIGFRKNEVIFANLAIVLIPMAVCLLISALSPIVFPFTLIDFLYLLLAELVLFSYFTIAYVYKKLLVALKGGNRND